MARKVLLAVDGSETGECVFDWYMNNIRHPDDEVHIVHCHDIKERTFPTTFITEPLRVNEMELEIRATFRNSKKILKSYCNRLQAESVQYKAYLRAAVHHIGAEICAVAAELNPNCIVVGCRGMKSLRRTILGSTSDYVLHHSNVPVIVVKRETK